MSTAHFIVGKALNVLSSMPDQSVDCIVTSPPYHLQRAYLEADHPDKAAEMGQEPTPAEFLENLLVVMDELWRVLDDRGTFWINLGDKHSNEGGLREGQPRYGPRGRFDGKNRGNSSGGSWRTDGWPLDQSVAWEPHLFGASLAYGRNLLSGAPHRQWITRPPVTWCKPSASPGRLDRRFRSATELIIYGGKRTDHYFDLDAVRIPSDYDRPNLPYATRKTMVPGQRPNMAKHTTNAGGSPPLNWWVVNHPGFAEAHFATFPPELIVRPILAGCPLGGTILDPFAGSGTTLAVATGHGRNAIGIDLDARNVELARRRVGMFLEVDGGSNASIVADVATGAAQ